MEDKIIDIAQLMATVIGGMYALYLYQASLKEKKTAFLFSIYEKLYSDVDISTVLYASDKNVGFESLLAKLVTNNVEQAHFEREVDKTLRFFDYLGSLLHNKQLSETDLHSFLYEIYIILSNPVIELYISHLTELDYKLKHFHRLYLMLEKESEYKRPDASVVKHLSTQETRH